MNRDYHRPSFNIEDRRLGQKTTDFSNARGKGSQQLTRGDMLREMMSPQSFTEHMPDDLSGSNEEDGLGLVRSDAGGRTDRIPAMVPVDSYVVPADVVSGLGQGNTEAGARILRQIESPHRKRMADGGRNSVHDKRHIIVAGGEYIVHPDTIRSVGGGDAARGHKVFDKFVVNQRRAIATRMAKLPGPRRD